MAVTETNPVDRDASTACTRYSVNHFADACRECGEEWPCRMTLLADNARLRDAITDAAEALAGGSPTIAHETLRSARDHDPEAQ